MGNGQRHPIPRQQFIRNRSIATAAYAARLFVTDAFGAQFHGSNSSSLLIL